MGHYRRHTLSDRRLKKQPEPQDPAGEREMEGGTAALVLSTQRLVIDQLLHEELLARDEHAAALYLYQDFLTAGLAPRLVGSYCTTRGCTPGFNPHYPRTVVEEAAYQRWHEAMKVMGGFLAPIAEAAICHDRRPPPEYVAFLRVAMQKLSKHYGLVVGCGEREAALDNHINEAAAWEVGIRRSRSDFGRLR
ncbi:MAG: hypothetical protein EOM37_07350 [Proteobacteria bacterium]|nr:hypothetical protein [Pseudomonadota bacterium]